MRKSIQAGIGLLALAGAAGGTVAAQTAPTAWLHVRVEEAKDASKVSVNLPLSVVEAVLKASPDIIEKHGKINLGRDHGLKLADLRRVWKELAAVGDAELVSVESDDENVKVQRKGDVVLVLVDKKPSTDKEGKKRKGGEQVRVEVPVSLVDAFLSGEGDYGNVEAAVLELRKRRGDIVKVQDDDSHVRVWIDEQNTQAPAGK
jgi:phosphoribosylanthranilate isomerase